MIMKITDLEKGFLTIVIPCMGWADSEPRRIGLVVVNILDFMPDGMVRITGLNDPQTITIVKPEYIYGMPLYDYSLRAIGFSPISNVCPEHVGQYDMVYSQDINGKTYYVTYDGRVYGLVGSKSSPLIEVEFVHDLQREIGKLGNKFEVSKHKFAE